MTAKRESLGQLIGKRRRELKLSLREVGDKAGTTDTTIMRIENGDIANPRGDVLRALAEALAIPFADVFTAAGYTIPTELPSFRPYMRAKYHDLPPKAINELERTFNDIAKRYGTTGPKPGEDEA